jgi:o-succinylbenzoate---CoA ligase
MSDWLSETSSLFKTNPYIIDREKVLSFRDINISAKSLAYFLQNKHCVKKGDIAAVLSENNIEFILLLFALWKLGAIPVPLNIKLNDSETKDILAFLEPDFIFTSHLTSHIYPDAKTINIVDFNKSPDKSGDEDIPALDYNENDLALILFTSGTSGNPKGVQISFRNLKSSFENSNTVLCHKPNDKWIASLPFYHIGGFSIIIRALLSGASLIIPPGSKIEDLADLIIIHKPSYISLVSTQLRRLINWGIKPWAELKYAILGGGQIEDSLVDEAMIQGWHIAKVYGSTETSSLVTFVDCNKDVNKKASGGKPLANNKILIVNDKKELLPPNKIGEIVINSNSCSNGYYNNSVDSNKKFKNGIYYTGDSGYIDADGYLYIESRMDDLIISGGENINPNEIEKVLKEHPAILNAAAFGQEDDEWGQVVSAAVIINPGSHISEKELKEFLLEKISSFKIPRKFYFMKEFPVSPLGKIQKDKLKDLIKTY